MEPDEGTPGIDGGLPLEPGTVDTVACHLPSGQIPPPWVWRGERGPRHEGRSPARPRQLAMSLAPPQREIRATRKRANTAQVVASWIQLIVK
jgi:hypothetical protein